MQVIATAGHVDHGKSTVVHALTGMQPDRWEEERRRGLTIDLGFAWTELPEVGEVAFVDVPGHERFVPNMLAGIGPVPAVLFVVAADRGWMPQSAEHLAALDALQIQHGLLVITRCDLADPAQALAQARRELAASALGAVPAVTVSGTTGAGLPELRTALARLLATLPRPDTTADIRLWIDRCFTAGGAGTVVTGTLAAGTMAIGDELQLAGSQERVRVRGLQTLGKAASPVPAVARVAVNVRGIARERLRRGNALLTPGAWWQTQVVDVALHGAVSDDLPGQLVLHIGSAAVAVRVRPLGPDAARLTLQRGLPLRVGDRALLRDPGRHRVAAGVQLLDVRPPELSRSGAARARARALATSDLVGLQFAEHGFLREGELRAMGLAVTGTELPGGWRCDPGHWSTLTRQLRQRVEEWGRAHPLQPGTPEPVLVRELGLPDERLLGTLVAHARLHRGDGQVRRDGHDGNLPAAVERALEILLVDFRQEPFVAPTAGRLAELGLGGRELAAAVRAGRLVKVADGVVLPPGAEQQAAQLLAALPQPFTASQARRALNTTRRVAVPLLELLARSGVTRRLPDGTHELR